MNIFRSGQGRTATITSLQWERKFRQSALQSNTGNFHAHVVACWQLGWLFVPAAAVRVWCSKVTCCSVPRMAAQPRPRWLLRALSAAVMWWQLWLWRAMPPGDWNKKNRNISRHSFGTYEVLLFHVRSILVSWRLWHHILICGYVAHLVSIIDVYLIPKLNLNYVLFLGSNF